MPRQVKRKPPKKKPAPPVKKKSTMRSRGEDHYKCRLSKKAVLKIREMWDNDEVSLGWLAHEYGVARSTIADICHRRTWKHLK